MNFSDQITKILNKSYASQCFEALTSRERQINHLIEQRKCPIDGWDDITIELLIQKLSLMDSNNFMKICPLGERESRIASEIVARRHFRMGHGVGRSGDLCEVQPKALGSSLMYKLANSLVLDILKIGSPSTKCCFIVPLATGMSLVLCLLTLRNSRPKAKYVIWPRIDQKSCCKCIHTAGFKTIVIQNKIDEESLVTDVEAIENTINQVGSDNVLCILTTTSCFAPRNPDHLEAVAKMCKDYNIPHVVNNAYGVQSSKCMHLIEKSSKIGRIDVYVQSTDKNFMVPVGGSIIAGFESKLINEISCSYPGRGSAVPAMDVLITLLHLGINGYKKLLSERKECMLYLKEKLELITSKYNEKVIETKNNRISVAITLSNLKSKKDISEIGSMLFTRCVSGTRVIISDGNSKMINDCLFKNWGSHFDSYPFTYLTAASAIGIKKDDVDIFIKRLDKVLSKFIKVT